MASPSKKVPQEQYKHKWTIPAQVSSAKFQEFLQQSHE